MRLGDKINLEKIIYFLKRVINFFFFLGSKKSYKFILYEIMIFKEVNLDFIFHRG